VNSSATALATVVSSAALNRSIYVYSHPIGKVIVPPLQGMSMSESHPGQGVTGIDSGSSDKEFSCPECGKGYTSRGGVRYHMKDCCPNELESCEECGELCLPGGIENHKSVKHGRSKVEKTCESCGDTFLVKPYRQESAGYCSRECVTRGTIAGWNKKERVEVTCERCGDTYEVLPRLEDKTRYCSNSCKHGERPTVECEYCGEEYDVAKYEKDKTRYCSLNCRNKAFQTRFSGKNSPVWSGGDVGYYGPNWFPQRREARIKYQSRCQGCGKTPIDTGRELSVHHIKPMRFYKENYDAPEWWQKANRLENLVPLCNNCHKRWEGLPVKPQLV